MAEFHMNISVAGRSDGASAVAGAAYIARTRIYDERVGLTRDYRRCHQHERLVADLGVSLPASAPERWRDRSTLWNEVERTESSARAQLCRRVEVALPVELARTAQIKLARGIAGYFVSQGMVVDACVHDAIDGHNPHLHMLMPLRACDGNGFLPKAVNEYLVRGASGDGRWMTARELRVANGDANVWSKVYRYRHDGERLQLTASEAEDLGGCRRLGKTPVQRSRYLVDWNDHGKAEEWRASIAALCNGELTAAGKTERVDHRSYARRGVDKIPTQHEGPAAFAIECRARRLQSSRGRRYRPVTARRLQNDRARRRNGLFALLLRELLYQLQRRARQDFYRSTGLRVPYRRSHYSNNYRHRGRNGRQFGW